MSHIFKRRSVDEYADSLAAYMPGGEIFAAAHISDTNFRNLIVGLATEMYRANGYLRDFMPGIIPDETVKFLDEWESALGIPCDCFDGEGDYDTRRRDVLVKLASSGIQTVDDFVELAELFGVTVTVTPGHDEITFPLTFPVLMFDTERESRFTIVVQFTGPDINSFPQTFPIQFGSDEAGILECLFNTLKPAHCQVIFQAAV
jgi:uncharacterized protein YmfQ (DUF2313 family)